MIPDPELVHYACIAHHHKPSETTIIAEYNSADSSLEDLAHHCLEQAPPHHSIFTHTCGNQTYTFVFDDPFVYFGIFDPNMLKHDQIQFSSRLKEALHHNIIKGNKNHKFTSHCFQGELHPIFHKLMSKSLDFDAPHLVPNGVYSSNTPQPVSSSSKGRKILCVPLLCSSKMGKGHKKKRFCGDATGSKEALADGKVDLLDRDGVGEVKSRDIVCQDGVCLIDDGGVGGRQKAKKIWRRHVWVVLILDLAVCLILFGIWLFVCRGFQCIEG